MADAHEWIVGIQNVAPVTLAVIGSVADSVEALLVAMGLALGLGRIERPPRGTRALVRRNALATATSTVADGLADANGVLHVLLLAGADIRADAIAILTAIATDRDALLLLRVLVALVAQALLGAHTNAVATSLGALGHAELLTDDVQFEARLANTSISLAAHAVITANGAGGHTLGLLVQHVVRIARAHIRSDAESVDTLLLADRVTFTEVVGILDVSIAADVDHTERGMRLGAGVSNYQGLKLMAAKLTPFPGGMCPL